MMQMSSVSEFRQVALLYSDYRLLVNGDQVHSLTSFKKCLHMVPCIKEQATVSVN